MHEWILSNAETRICRRTSANSFWNEDEFYRLALRHVPTAATHAATAIVASAKKTPVIPSSVSASFFWE